MAQIDVDEIKRVSSELSERRNLPPRFPQTSEALVKNRNDIHKLLESYLEKTGLDVDELNKLIMDGQAERRRLFAKQVSDHARESCVDELRLRHALEDRHKALQLLATPFQPSFVTIDRPILILVKTIPEILEILTETHYESLNSFVKISCNVTGIGEDKGMGCDSTFYFLWQNPNQFAAVANVKTSLMLNGTCEAISSPGFFSGSDAKLVLQARLRPRKWIGWGAGNDQTYFYITDQVQTTDRTLAFLVAHGGSLLFGSTDIAFREFNFEPVQLGFDQILIPGNASILFEVTLATFLSGSDEDRLILNFAADEAAQRIICPSVVLELFTPLSVLATTAA